MCSYTSLVMPADYEMLVSHSPPVFNSYLTEYPSSRFSRDGFPKYPRGNCRSASSNCISLNIKTNSTHTPASPKRPCLVIRPEDTHTSSDEDPTSPTRLKKKVVFADDRGMSLTQVRIMTEPSNVPPLLNSRFLAEVTQGLNADPLAHTEPWEITFAQPASDYVEFRRKLELNRVSLENVIVKEAEDFIIGTVKVSNISFEKEVFIRSSCNDWKTHEDTFCKYVSNTSAKLGSPAYVLFDTFSFKLALPPKARRLEFCVCFRCTDLEHWDSFDGKNYVLVKKAPAALQKSFSTDELLAKARLNSPPRVAQKFSDAVYAKMDSWSEFASWTHLDNCSPYW